MREKNRRNRLAVFLDNCGIHTAADVLDEAKKLKIVIVRNVPYSPWFNGIERVWGRMKWIFRREVLRLKIDQERVSLKNMVPRIAT